jgi:hypothetical protein
MATCPYAAGVPRWPGHAARRAELDDEINGSCGWIAAAAPCPHEHGRAVLRLDVRAAKSGYR